MASPTVAPGAVIGGSSSPLIRLYPAAILDEIEGALQATEYLERHIRELGPVAVHIVGDFPVARACDELVALRAALYRMRTTAAALYREAETP